MGARVSLIAAMDRNRLIGRGGDLPWHLPADLRHFRAVTMGKPILMGRSTYESIGRPLPGRDNIVVSARGGFSAPGCRQAKDLAAALALAGEVPEVMIIGGARLYAAALPAAQRMYLTLIDHEFDGDTWFPAYKPAHWREVERIERDADPANPWPLAFVVLDRRGA